MHKEQMIENNAINEESSAESDTLDGLTATQKNSRLMALLSVQLAMLMAMAGCSFSVAEKVVKPFLIILFAAIKRLAKIYFVLSYLLLPTILLFIEVKLVSF